MRGGWDRIAIVPGAAAVFVPPWNDLHPALGAVLGDLGYRALSAHGAVESEGLRRIDVHLDLMRWRGGIRFRGRRRFAAGLRLALAERRRRGFWDAPIGLLTHHLVHDEAAWAFLAEFLTWTKGQPALDWVSLETLLDCKSAGGRGGLQRAPRTGRSGKASCSRARHSSVT